MTSIDILRLVSSAVSILAVAVLWARIVVMTKDRKKLVLASIQLQLDKDALLAQIDKLAAEISLSNAPGNDGFVRFLSESRASAFEYIEDVQNAISNFVADAEPFFNTPEDKYAYVVRTSEGFRRATAAYRELERFLPEESSKK